MSRFSRRDEQDHSYFEERLSAYLDGELAAREHRAVEQHLKVCKACRWELSTLKQTVAWLSELPTVQVPRVFTIPANVVPAPPARRPRWRFVPAMQFATALVAVLLFFAAAGDVMLTGWPWGTAGSEPMMLQEVGLEQPVAEMPAAKDIEETLVVESPALGEPYGGGVGATEPAASMAEEAVPEEPPMVMMQQSTPEEATSRAASTPVTPAVGDEPGAEQEQVPEDSAQPEAETAPALPSVSLPETLTANTPAALPTAEPELVDTPAPAPQPTDTRAPRPTLTREPAAVVVPTPTALPTIHPRATDRVQSPTAVVQVQEPLPPADEARDLVESRALTSGENWAVFWLRIVEYVLAVALVVLAGVTIVLMVLRRQQRAR